MISNYLLSKMAEGCANLFIRGNNKAWLEVKNITKQVIGNTNQSFKDKIRIFIYGAVETIRGDYKGKKALIRRENNVISFGVELNTDLLSKKLKLHMSFAPYFYTKYRDIVMTKDCLIYNSFMDKAQLLSLNTEKIKEIYEWLFALARIVERREKSNILTMGSLLKNNIELTAVNWANKPS